MRSVTSAGPAGCSLDDPERELQPASSKPAPAEAWERKSRRVMQLSSLVQLDLNRATRGGHSRNMSSGGVFLKAEWRSLAMLNYEVEPDRLPTVGPAGTELDRWKGKVHAS